MPLVAVKYEGEIKDTVDAYNAWDKEIQSGDYWESTEEEVKKVKKYIKDHYKIAQDFTCAYCQQKVLINHGRVWDIEHIIPKNPYPKFLFTEKNLALSCPECNGFKSDKKVLVNPNRKTFPKKSEDYIIVHPHFDEYDKYIKIITNQFYLPINDKGRKTIEICGLLRFAYTYTNYAPTPVDITNKMLKLNKAFMDASSSIERMAISGLLRDLLNHSDKIDKESYLKSL